MTMHVLPSDSKGYFGRIAFEAYANHVDWGDHQGDPIPEWGELPFLIRQGWEEAALAVLYKTEEHNG
jgi:hypothetical protein